MKRTLWCQPGQGSLTCGAIIDGTGEITPKNMHPKDPLRKGETGVKLMVRWNASEVVPAVQREATARTIRAAANMALRTIGVRPGLPAETLVRITPKDQEGRKRKGAPSLLDVGVVVADTPHTLQVIRLTRGGLYEHELTFSCFEQPKQVEVIQGYWGVSGLLVYWAERKTEKNLPISQMVRDDAFLLAFIDARRKASTSDNRRGRNWTDRDHVQAASEIRSKDLAAQIVADSSYPLEVRITCIDATEDLTILRELLATTEREYRDEDKYLYLDAGWGVISRVLELNKTLIDASSWVRFIIDCRKMFERGVYSDDLKQVVRLLQSNDEKQARDTTTGRGACIGHFSDHAPAPFFISSF